MQRGQLSLIAAITGSLATVIVGTLSAWATATSAISSVKEQVSIVQEREINHYDEIQKQLGDVNKKLDLLILRK